MLLGKDKIVNGQIVRDKKTVDETKVFENWKGLEVGKTYQQPDGRKFKVLKEEYSGVGGRTPFITVKYLDSKTKDAEYPEVYKGFYIHLQSNDKLEGYRNDSKGNTKSFVKNTWNELKSVIDKYWADNPNGDSKTKDENYKKIIPYKGYEIRVIEHEMDDDEYAIFKNGKAQSQNATYFSLFEAKRDIDSKSKDSLDDEDILTLDEKEMEEFFVKDAPPNYYGAIVAVAQSANNPLATREYVRKQIEPFMQAKGVPFVENEFNQAYSEFNKAGTSKAAFFKGRDTAGDVIENYHGFEIREVNNGVDVYLNGTLVIADETNVASARKEIDAYRAERKAKFQQGVKNMDSVSVKTKQELLTEMVELFKSKTYDEAIEIAHYFPVVKVEEALMKGGFNKSLSQAGSRFLRGIITKDQFRAVESKSLMVRSYSVKTDKLTKDAAQSAGLPGGISQSEYSAEKKLLQDQLQKAVASGNTFKAKEVEKELASLEQEFKTKDSISESELKRRNPAAWHSIQIAKKTLRMPDAMLGVMGETSKERAREILKEYDIPFTEDSKDAGVGRIVRTIGWYNIIEGVGTDGGYWFARSDKEDKRFKSREEAEDYARAKTGDSKTKDAKTKDEYYIWVDFKGDKRNEITKIVGKRPDGGGTWVNTGEGDVSFSFKTKEEAQAAKQKVLAIPGVRVRIGSYDSVTKDAVLEKEETYKGVRYRITKFKAFQGHWYLLTVFGLRKPSDEINRTNISSIANCVLEAKRIIDEYYEKNYSSKTKDAVLEFNNVLVSVNKSSNGKYLAIARVDGQNQKVEGFTKEEAVRGIRQIIEEKTIQR